jgi:hypothetical protein
MSRLRALLRRPPDRRRSASLRLWAARRRLERSTQALRRAALDHIDDQILVGLMLQATLARITAQGIGAP